ncbi:hypothetical protein SLE2022_009730 [Rubroshorea leprosula]
MDCEGCERKVRKSVEGMKGVTVVEVDPKQSRLTVTGYVEPEKVLDRLRHRTGMKAEFWPSFEAKYTTAFSDENPTARVIM